MKKNITILLIYTVLCTAAFAQNANDYKFDGKGTITGYDGWDTALIIPAQIGGVPVTAIGNGAFRNMGLTSITFPASLKSIGGFALSSNKLTAVVIPAGVSVGVDAFSNNQLTNLTVGNGCSFARNPFGRDNLGNLVLGLGADVHFEIETFSDLLYYDYLCNGRKAGTYENSVTYHERKEGDYRFCVTKYGVVITGYDGNEGNRLVIPQQLGGAAVKGIGRSSPNVKGAFENKSVSRMQLPDGLVFISGGAFSRNQLTSVTFPDSILFIEAGAFLYNRLTSVTFGNSIISIGEWAFDYNQLTNVSIPDSVTAIGVGAFFRNQLTSVTSIGEWAFRGNKLTGVTIGNSVTFIGEYAFENNQLTSVTIGNSVTSIGEKAFDDYNNLQTAYASSGAGTYTRPNANSREWIKRE